MKKREKNTKSRRKSSKQEQSKAITNNLEWQHKIEHIFARWLVAKEIINRDIIISCIKHVELSNLQLSQILLQKSILSAQDLVKARQDFQNLAFVCRSCQKQTPISILHTIKHFNCPNCNNTLEEPQEIKDISFAVESTLLKKKQFGAYELIGEIARGGMGIVYKACLKDSQKIVALKVLRSLDMADEMEMARFKREVDTAGKLDHPYIVPIYDFGNVDEIAYFTMEYIEGVPLDTILMERTLGLKQALDLVVKIVDAMGYAHSQNIIHRDLKPANILMDDDFNPHITDFGLAKDISDSMQLTQSGATMGTPHYMAPEQIDGIVENMGPATDVYTLGVILYELTTGQLPFHTDSISQLYHKICSEDPPQPRSINPTISINLENIILKAMTRDHQQRYRSAKSLAKDLRRYHSGKHVKARSRKKSKWHQYKIPLWIFLGILFLSMMFLLLPADRSKPKVKSNFIKIELLKKWTTSKDHSKIKKYAQKLIKDYPDHPKTPYAYYYLGLMYEQQGESGRAEESFLDLFYYARNKRQQTLAVKKLMEKLLAQKQIARARKLYQKIANQKLQDPELNWLCAEVLIKTGDFSQSLSHLKSLPESFQQKKQYQEYYAWCLGLGEKNTYKCNATAMSLIEFDKKPGLEIVVWQPQKMEIYSLFSGKWQQLCEISPPQKTKFHQGVVVADINKDKTNDLIMEVTNSKGHSEIQILFHLKDRLVRKGKPYSLKATGGPLWAGTIGPGSGPFILAGVGPYLRNTKLIKRTSKNWQAIPLDGELAKNNTDTLCVDAGDLDNDQVKEIVLGTGPWTFYDLRVYKHSKKEQKFKLHSRKKLGQVTQCKIADINNDGYSEILATKSYTFNSKAFTGNPQGELDGLYIYSWREQNLELLWQSHPGQISGEKIVFSQLSAGNMKDLGPIAVCRYSDSGSTPGYRLWLIRYAKNRYIKTEFFINNMNITHCRVGDVDGDGEGELVLLGNNEIITYGKLK